MATCGLCLEDKELKTSHLIPASAYRSVRDDERGNPNPIVISAGHARSTSKQVQKPFLCADCEERFNQGGENVVSKYYASFEKSPLVDALKTIEPSDIAGEVGVFDLCSILGDDAHAFTYFSASIFWRASATNWVDERRKLDLINLGPYEGAFRRFLLGEGGLPRGVVLHMHVPKDPPEMIVTFPASTREHGYRSHRFYVPGALFSAYVGNVPPKGARELSLNADGVVSVFVAPLKNASLFRYVRDIRNVRLSKRLKERFNRKERE